jgi:hypothetical protein
MTIKHRRNPVFNENVDLCIRQESPQREQARCR